MTLESPEQHEADTRPASAAPQPFGSYVLLKRLGRGGMGDVFVAKQSRVAGIEKVCVVKRIRSRFTDDREYVARFIDEARTVVLLSHRNVCQVFDVGAVDGAYYLAMELVPGRDVRLIEERARRFDIAIPVPIALHIVGEVLEALDFAHRLTDPISDAPLGLVHRDVSPQNVIVSFEGEVKLIDFGLAASKLKLEQTEPGVILGKLQYMAPEQARFGVVDKRADVFATGVVLYELLAGERFYEGLGSDAVAALITAPEPVAHQPKKLAALAPALRNLIARATAPSPRERFPTAAAFQKALRDVQVEHHWLSTSTDAREFMATLFPGEEADDRKERARLTTQATRMEDASGKSVRFATAPGVDDDAPRIASGTDRVHKLITPKSDAPIDLDDVARALAEPDGPDVPTDPSHGNVFARPDEDRTEPMPHAPAPGTPFADIPSTSPLNRFAEAEPTQRVARAPRVVVAPNDTIAHAPAPRATPRRGPPLWLIALIVVAIGALLAYVLVFWR